MAEIDRDLILMDLLAETKEEVIRAIVGKMEEKGYVGQEYCREVLLREESFPTGLPSEGVITAIPHAFCKDVKRTCMGAAQLRNPVGFYNASDNQEELPAELVFVMANADGDEAHLGVLQDLMNAICKKQMLMDLRSAKTAQEFADIFAACESYEEE